MSARSLVRFTSVLLVLVGLLVPVGASAQAVYRLSIDYLDGDGFPVVDAYVSVTDSRGFLVTDLLGPDFVVTEDGLPVSAFTTSRVQNTKQPLALMLVIDASSYANRQPLPTGLQQSVDAAKDFVDLLQPQDLVGILAYADTPIAVSAFSTDRTALKASLDGIDTGNKAAMYDALNNAVDLLETRAERRVIILISNGKDTRSRQTVDQVTTAAKEAGVQIYPIGIGDEVNIEGLRKLAQGTGGTEFIQPSPNALKAAFDSILQVVREQYLVTYTSRLQADQLKHILKVQATVQGVQVAASAEFVARPGLVNVILPYKDDQIVGGDVVFQPEVESSGAVQKMEIALDGLPLDVKQVPQEMKYIWDSTTVDPGIHELAVKITDQAGATGTTKVRLNVQPAVTVKITAPLPGANVRGMTKITAEATTVTRDPVSSLQIAFDGGAAIPLAGPPYSYDWNTSLVDGGQHTIRITGLDKDAHPGQAELTVFVLPPYVVPPWLIALAVIVLAAVVIPLAARSRKRRLSGGGGVAPAKVRAGAAHLRELSGENPNQAWPLGAAEVRLGRKRDENDIPLAGKRASRHHAVIRYEGGQHVIYSLKPENPVIVNSRPTSQHALQPGDVIQLGDTTLRYE